MPMYNVLEYSDNYSMTSGSLWNYYRDGINYDGNNNRISSDKPNDINAIYTELAVPLKYQSNF